MVSGVGRGGVRLFTFDSSDPFAVQENSYTVSLVPCAISNFSDFVRTQTSTVNKINPGRERRRGSLRLDSLCCGSSLISRCGFLVPVFDLSNFAIDALRSSVTAVPDSVTLFPRVIHIDRSAVDINDSLADHLTGWRGWFGGRQLRCRQQDLLCLA